MKGYQRPRSKFLGDSTTKTTKETTTKGDEETKPTMETTTKFDPSVNCGEPGTMVDWKGAKNSRILYRSMSGVLMRVNFFNNAKAYDIVSDPYFGFLGFAKKNCGIDFINALDDGRVSLKMYDWGAYYDNFANFKRVDGRHTAYMAAFDRFLSHTFK